MTGYGSGTATKDGISAFIEIRSVNNRFCEVTARLPKSLQTRELEIKELIRTRMNRGKINLSVSIEKDSAETLPVKVNIDMAKAYAKLLNDIRNEIGIKEEIRLDTLLNFSEVLTVPEATEQDAEEWELAQQALEEAIAQIQTMRRNEGLMITEDLNKRIDLLSEKILSIEELSSNRVQEEMLKLKSRIAELIGSEKIDQQRLELEIALLADKLDITEECVRFRSHVKFFLDILHEEESSGRKLNFLLQEMNREANTIGSKSNHAGIAQLVVGIKDELERIREQIQNIE